VSDRTATEPVVEDSGSGWTTDESSDSPFLTYRFVLVGLASGLVGGMGAFMFSRAVLVPSFATAFGRQTPGLVVTALAGMFAYLLARDGRESAKAMVVGLFVALATLITARISPAFLLPFPAPIRDLIIQDQLEYVAHTTFNVLLLIYWGGYLGALSLFGYFDY